MTAGTLSDRYGPFRLLVRLQGARRFSEIAARTAARMMLFQLVLVLLGSLVSKSLFTTLDTFLHDPSQIPLFLARAVPAQSTFFPVPSLYLPCTFPVPSLYLPIRCPRSPPSSSATS